MTCKVVPLRFDSVIAAEYDAQLDRIQQMYGEDAVFLPSVRVGDPIPPAAQAVVFPILVGEAYHQLTALATIHLPMIIITSSYGTMAMWDWEILTVFREVGMTVFAPYHPDLAHVFFRTVALRDSMKGARFMVWQDTPGDGMQADIFKRFFWWEAECTRRIREKFGIEIVIRSYKALGDRAKAIPDARARQAAREHEITIDPAFSETKLLSAYKLYLAICDELAGEENIVGVGANCLNESFNCDTTPCLAWSLLYQERGLAWSCEGDTMSLLTQFIIDRTVKAPVMMTNIYPFLVGMAALAHEKISEFPNVPDPDDHALLVHCGYFGLVPPCMASRWALKDKVLAIVDENAHALDAEIGTGPMTLAKIHSSFDRLFICDAEMEQYVQYPGSDCRNGGLIRVRDGRALVEKLYSHHVSIIPGKQRDALSVVAQLLELTPEKC